MTEWTIVAKLYKAKNKEGGLFVSSTKGLLFLLTSGMEVCFVPPVLRVPRYARVLRIEKVGGKNLVFFEGVSDQNTAEELMGHYCLVRVDDLPDGWNEQTELDLCTFSVVSPAGELLGTIEEVQSNPAHPLLVLRSEQKQADLVLIPFVDEFVVGIDEDEKCIVMDLPSGLLEV